MPADANDTEIEKCFELAKSCGRLAEDLHQLWLNSEPGARNTYRRLYNALDQAEQALNDRAHELY